MKRNALVLDEVVGNPDCPAMRRTVLAIGGWSLRLHRFSPNYSDTHFHDHPWSFATFVLRGGYVDVDRHGNHDALRALHFRFRPARHAHRLMVGDRGCVTLVLTGPLVHDWGFWVRNGFYRWHDYRLKFPPAPCSPSKDFEGVPVLAAPAPEEIERSYL